MYFTPGFAVLCAIKLDFTASFSCLWQYLLYYTLKMTTNNYSAVMNIMVQVHISETRDGQLTA